MSGSIPDYPPYRRHEKYFQVKGDLFIMVSVPTVLVTLQPLIGVERSRA